MFKYGIKELKCKLIPFVRNIERKKKQFLLMKSFIASFDYFYAEDLFKISNDRSLG